MHCGPDDNLSRYSPMNPFSLEPIIEGAAVDYFDFRPDLFAANGRSRSWNRSFHSHRRSDYVTEEYDLGKDGRQ